MSGKVDYKDEVKIKVKKPKLYKVFLHNDNYTTMEFVVYILENVFNKKEIDANKIMLDVHKKGLGLVGVYSYDIAITKIQIVEKMAKSEAFPLKVSMEVE